MRHSDELKNLAKSLAKFQANIKDPARNNDNLYFKSKYVALDGLLDAVRPVLSANGLSFIQSPVSNGQDMGVTTLLMHESGEWIESDPFMLHAIKNDPQSGGSAITYARRYSLSAVLGVAWDDDDDGNASTRPVNAQEEKPTTNYTKETKKTVKTEPKTVEPKTVNDYYALTIEWAKEHKAVTLIVPLMEQHFHKKRFQTLTFNEAKTFYDNLPKLVKQMQDEDDAALMNGVG